MTSLEIDGRDLPAFVQAINNVGGRNPKLLEHLTENDLTGIQALPARAIVKVFAKFNDNSLHSERKRIHAQRVDTY